MSIAEAVANATNYLTEHPDEARYRDSMAVAHLVEGLRVDVHGTDGSSLQTDMPKGIGGTGQAALTKGAIRAQRASFGIAPTMRSSTLPPRMTSIVGMLIAS